MCQLGCFAAELRRNGFGIEPDRLGKTFHKTDGVWQRRQAGMAVGLDGLQMPQRNTAVARQIGKIDAGGFTRRRQQCPRSLGAGFNRFHAETVLSAGAAAEPPV